MLLLFLMVHQLRILIPLSPCLLLQWPMGNLEVFMGVTIENRNCLTLETCYVRG